MRALFWLILSFIAIFVVGCAGSGISTGGTDVKGISITPKTFAVKPNEKIQLTAVMDGGTQPITWAVNTPSGGTITNGGVYTAPGVSGTYEVQVSLTSDPAKVAKATANVDSGYVVSISTPNSVVNVPYGGTLQLAATVKGASSSDVTWSTTYGTISTSGLFTAPTTSGDAVVKAISTADPGKSTTLTLHVVPPVTLVDPTAAKLAMPKSYVNFSALVNGTASTNVTWTASSGTITTDGKWTADASYLGDVTITATSGVDTSKSDSTTVKVVSNLNVRFSFENQGDVVLALRPDKAPNTSANLASLANAKFYDGIYVHRYEAGFVVQWGDPLTKTLPLTDPSIGTGGPGYTIDFEANDLLHKKYSLGMARSSSLNSAGSQIYICLNDEPSLDGSYVVFGSVLSGTSVVDALRKGDKITTARVELP